MDCNDMIIGAARGTRFRVLDYYTRDRSTPRTDDVYGGQDDITAAVGTEKDGVTTLIIRKKLAGNSHILIPMSVMHDFFLSVSVMSSWYKQ